MRHNAVSILISRYSENCYLLIENADIIRTKGLTQVNYIVFASSLASLCKTSSL